MECRNLTAYFKILLLQGCEDPYALKYATISSTTVKVTKYGTKIWSINGNLHRLGDKPAVIGSDGSRWWYENGKLHRLGDKPAVIWSDGNKLWYENGMRHRPGGKTCHNLFGRD